MAREASRRALWHGIRGAKQNARRVNVPGIPVVRYQLLANLNVFASSSTLAWSIPGELIVIVVIGGLYTVFGPLMGELVFLGFEEILKSFTGHWMVIFAALIVIVAPLGKSGIIGRLQHLDSRAKPPLKNTKEAIVTAGVAKGVL